MAALGLVPSEVQIFNLGLREIGSKISRIKTRLDKTEYLVNSLAEMKLAGGGSLMIDRQVGDRTHCVSSSNQITRKSYRWTSLTLKTLEGK